MREALQRVLRLDDLVAVFVGEAVLAAPFVDLLPPFFQRGGLSVCPRFQTCSMAFMASPASATGISTGTFLLIELGRCRYGFFRVRREGIDAARHAVVEARADIDHDVAIMHRQLASNVPCMPSMPSHCSPEAG
jgi:hypothetical protein